MTEEKPVQFPTRSLEHCLVLVRAIDANPNSRLIRLKSGVVDCDACTKRGAVFVLEGTSFFACAPCVDSAKMYGLLQSEELA